VSVRSAAGAFPANRHFFADLKDLDRQSTAPNLVVVPVGPHEVRVQLSAPTTGYVYFAHVTSPYESTRFSDNYVDLLPGETREIVVNDPQRDVTAESLRLGWG
jgi:beta-mannosidase